MNQYIFQHLRIIRQFMTLFPAAAGSDWCVEIDQTAGDVPPQRIFANDQIAPPECTFYRDNSHRQ